MYNQKQTIPQFIQKILDMIQKYPQAINWSQDGLELLILNEKTFSQIVLPDFFRHDKIQSFVRQLNMYGFHKICRNKNSINFKNDNFVRDLPQKYILIKRRKKELDQQKVQIFNNQKEIQQILSSKYAFSHPTMLILVESLLNFKKQNIRQMQHLKKKLDELGREVNQRKSKKVKPLLTSTRQLISYINQNSDKIEVQIEKVKSPSNEDTYSEKGSFAAPIIPHPVGFSFFQTVKNVEFQGNYEKLNDDHSNIVNTTSSNTGNSIFNGLGISALCSFNSVTNFMA